MVNRHGRLVFPANLFGELDFSVLETLDQFTAVIGRDFEAKAPTGTDILARVEAGTYPGRFELLRDLAQNSVLGQPVLDHDVREAADALARCGEASR